MEHGEDNLSIFDQSLTLPCLVTFISVSFLMKMEQRVYYAGSTIQQNHGESNDDKGFSVWTINSKDDWTVEHHTLQKPPTVYHSRANTHR